MNKLTTLKYFAIRTLPVFALALALATTFVAPDTAHASADRINDGVQAVNEDSSTDFEGILQNVINILLFLVGATAVIMLIVGGFRYVTSNGDSSAISSAKNTILYSVIGIVVALAAFAIVTFVLDQF